MTRRRRAREVCLQMLYQTDVNPDVSAETVRELIREQIASSAMREFCWELFAGVMESRPLLDDRIQSVAENWSLKRMAPTDRNTLRLGAFEILFTETPKSVVINEAVELARKFGTDQSPQFVNGILDKLSPAESSDSQSKPEDT
ncbi:MAG: transcription antitermination factor NusB [Planctomycetaceae bacterium]